MATNPKHMATAPKTTTASGTPAIGGSGISLAGIIIGVIGCVIILAVLVDVIRSNAEITSRRKERAKGKLEAAKKEQ